MASEVRCQFLPFCGDDAYNYVQQCFQNMQRNLDIIVFHTPKEWAIGHFIANQVNEIWKRAVKEYRDMDETDEELNCDICKGDILKDSLTCVPVDISYLLTGSFLHELSQNYLQKKVMIIVAISNEMLRNADVLLRIHYLKQRDVAFGITNLQLFTTERLTEENFLFSYADFTHFFDSCYPVGMSPKIHNSQMKDVKDILWKMFSVKCKHIKYKHRCFRNYPAYECDISSSEGDDTVL